MEAVNHSDLLIQSCPADLPTQLGDVLQTLVVVLVVSSSLNHFWVEDEFLLPGSCQDYPGIYHSMKRFHLSYLQLDTL
jgi:hypothetical protein